MPNVMVLKNHVGPNIEMKRKFVQSLKSNVGMYMVRLPVGGRVYVGKVALR